MNEKCCLNCGNWDTYDVPPRCGLMFKQNNPTAFQNEKYYFSDRKNGSCDEWKVSPFTVYFN